MMFLPSRSLLGKYNLGIIRRTKSSPSSPAHYAFARPKLKNDIHDTLQT